MLKIVVLIIFIISGGGVFARYFIERKYRLYVILAEIVAVFMAIVFWHEVLAPTEEPSLYTEQERLRNILPPSIISYLDLKYPGWQFCEPNSEIYIKEVGQKGGLIRDPNISTGPHPSLVLADFNGDALVDYGIQFSYAKESKHITIVGVFMENNKAYAPYGIELLPYASDWTYLMAGKRDSKGGWTKDGKYDEELTHENEILVLGFLERHALTYYFKGGKFYSNDSVSGVADWAFQ